MFRRVPIHTPFAVGSVNTYLAGRTVVDPGPDCEESWTELLDALDTDDLQPTDVERVIITHPHPDHFGLANRLREAGADVVAGQRAAEIMGDFAGHFEHERAYFTPLLTRWGLDEDTAETVTGLPEAYLGYAPSVETDRVVDEGDTVTVDGTDLAVEETLGHAESELLLRLEADGERQAIVGDHVLPDITPNPLLQAPIDPDGERPHPLPKYNESLDALAAEPLDRLLPGHREEITDPAGRIRDIRDAHEERTDNVADIVDGPTTPAEVMRGLFGDLPATETFSGMSEAVGHLDVLEDRERVIRTDRGGVVVYEPNG
jgi:glyoxylase-like metal-dependent hydrolase (beta-lactamase superfamily II)